MEATTTARQANGATPEATTRAALAPRRRGSDAYDSLLWRLQSRLDQSRGRNDGAGFLVGVTSCDRRAGVSTVAANLAIRAADHQMRPVLLVDGATERPVLGRQFRLRNVLGLADVVAGRCTLQEATHEVSVDGLEVMPAGTAGLIDRAGIDPQRLEALLAGLRESHQFVVFDMPPASVMRHMLIVARRLDATLLTVRSEATSRGLIERTAEQLRNDGVDLTGTVVSRRRQHLPAWVRRFV